MLKLLKYLLIIFLITTIPNISCADEYNLENNIGLYKVIETNCEISDGLYNPCGEIKFIELVKGKFYGIKPDELALVFWRCDDSSNEYGCAYESQQIKNHKKIFISDNNVFLSQETNQNKPRKEFFMMKDGKIFSYHYKLTTKNKAGEMFFRDFNYKLIKTSRDKISSYKLLYPDD